MIEHLTAPALGVPAYFWVGLVVACLFSSVTTLVIRGYVTDWQRWRRRRSDDLERGPWDG